MSVEYFQTYYLQKLSFRKGTRNNIVYISAPPLQLAKLNDPPLTAPFGMSAFKKEEEEGKLSMDMNIDAQGLKEWLEALDVFILEAALKNKRQWFSLGTTDDQVRKMYHPLLLTTKEFCPRLRAKISPSSVATFHLSSDGVSTRCDSGELRVKGVKVLPIVQFNCIWFQRTQFGASITVQAAAIVSSSTQGEEFSNVWK